MGEGYERGLRIRIRIRSRSRIKVRVMKPADDLPCITLHTCTRTRTRARTRTWHSHLHSRPAHHIRPSPSLASLPSTKPIRKLMTMTQRKILITQRITQRINQRMLSTTIWSGAARGSVSECHQHHRSHDTDSAHPRLPTDQPTNRPTDRPTNRPTDQPTNRPTDQPTT